MHTIPLIGNDALLTWVQTLTGLHTDRVREAARHVVRWGIHHLSQELLSRPSVDNAVAVVHLSEAVQALITAGVPESKLLGKLRRDREVWPTWAELRAAALLLRVAEARLSLEAGRGAGKHPDFHISVAGGPVIPIEFKAIGLSDEEAGFCRRVTPALDGYLPPYDLLTLHADLDTTAIRVNPGQLRQMHSSAASSALNLPTYPQGLGGVTIVGHGGEANYARRLWMRLTNEVLLQIPQDGKGWAAFYWSNGAPTTAVLELLRQKGIPKGLAGIILLGDAVAFPAPSIHSFVSNFWATTRDEDRSGRLVIKSEVNNAGAKNVLVRFENSSGVRATLLCATEGGTRIELLRRDGHRRILPFNLVIDPDPSVDQKSKCRLENEAMLEEYRGADSVADFTRATLKLRRDSP